MSVTHFEHKNGEFMTAVNNEVLDSENSLPGSSKGNSLKFFLEETASENDLGNSETKQLAIIPSNIIESTGKHFAMEKIDKNVFHIINYHCSFKLLKIIKAATDYMKHCGRLKFTSEDFNKGLFFCGENLSLNYEILLSPKKKGSRKRKNSEMIQKINSKTQYVYIKEIWLNGKSPLSASINELSDKLQNYFKVVTEVIFSNDEEVFSIILNDLKTNKNIIQLVPYLVNFFCDTMSKFQCDFLKISLLLQFVNALLRNHHLYFGQDSYLNILSVTLLKFLAANLPYSVQGRDYWLLKDTAANIVARILKKSKSQHLFFEVIYFVQSVLLTFQNSLNSHYGVLFVLNSIGVPAILLVLPSYIHRFHEHIKVILPSGNQTFDSQMVQGQIIRSYHLLVDYYFKNELRKPKFNSKFYIPDYLQNISVFPILSQSTFSDYFGEAVLPAFPLLNFVSSSTHLKKRKNKIIGNLNKKLCFKNCKSVNTSVKCEQNIKYD